MSADARKIDDSVLAVLSAGRCDGLRYFLPVAQLDRKMYESVDKVLGALGGKWNRSAKAHVFAADCTDRIESAIETGEFARPADMGWFPTPPALADRIVSMANVLPGMKVLEPSAGNGALVSEILRRGADAYCVEIDSGRAQALLALQPWVIQIGDFLTHVPPQRFDRVVMNPPFAKRADIHHVLHARRFLSPDGLLVSIMSAGVAFRQDRLTTEFRAKCASIEPLPDGSFVASGTGVRTVVVTMLGAME